MTPATLDSGLFSLWRAQPATYGAALLASPSGWRLHEPSDNGATKSLAMLQMIAGFGGRIDRLRNGSIRHL